MTLALAFLGGAVSCLSPCVLPVIPVLVSYVASGPRDGGSAALFASGALDRRSTTRAVGFLVGFAGIFVALWVSLGLVGFALFDAVPLARQVAGVAIVGLGLLTVAGWQPMFSMPRLGGAGSFGGSFLLGAGVALGWTPCIGPTLGAILTLAAASSSVWAGAALLLAYAVGMAVPLLVAAVGLSRIPRVVGALARHHRVVEVVSGALIVGVGVLVATNGFGRLAGLIPWTF